MYNRNLPNDVPLACSSAVGGSRGKKCSPLWGRSKAAPILAKARKRKIRECNGARWERGMK